MQDSSQTPSSVTSDAASDVTPEVPAEVPAQVTAEVTAEAVDLPTLEDLDAVAGEVQRVEAALGLLDKKNSPMCAACQSAFTEATAQDRLELLQCAHGGSDAA